VTIANLLDSRTLHRDTMSSILDMLAVAAVLVDASANIMHANASALRYFEEGTALLRDGEKLSANSERCNHDLRLAITEAAAAGEVRVPKTGLSVVLKGTDDRDLAAWVLPLGSGLRLSLGAPYAAQAAVFVRELGSTSPFPAELFVRHYGVTPDECRLLMALVQGMTLKDAADTLGIAHATAKSHLARLFQKTGSERQADLVRLAMTALAPATA
jgi:DNA-binding CsgD family transcriptional regulator